MSDINSKTETIDIVLSHNMQQTPHEHFTISSIKASEILGVNRTRLSQLTTQGIFPYERRKIDARSRLFYRLNDLLNYQRKSSFGNLPNSENAVKFDSTVPLLPPHSLENSASTQSTDTTHTMHVSSQNIKQSTQLKISQSFLNKNESLKTRVLEKALVLKNIKNERDKLESLHQTVTVLKDQMNQIVSFISKLELQIAQMHAQKLNVKKSVLRRPRAKGMFKLIKR